MCVHIQNAIHTHKINIVRASPQVDYLEVIYQPLILLTLVEPEVYKELFR